MKKMFLLLGFCCFISILQAQEFKIEYYKLIDQKEGEANYVSIRIENIDEALGIPFYSFFSYKASKVSDYLKNCEKWANQNLKKIVTKEIKKILRDTTKLEGKRFVMTVYFDKQGKVLTVIFSLSQSIYDRLTVNQFKEIYRKLMKEKIQSSDFCEFEAKSVGIGTLGIDFIKLVQEKRLKFD